jgi:hypothetical protein
MASARIRLKAGAREAALLQDVSGGACAPMCATHVLRKSGHAPRVDVADLVRANGGDPSNVLDFQMGRAGVLQALDKMKIPYRTVTNPSSMAELEAIVRQQRGTTIFGVLFENGERHAMVAFIDDAGRFKIWDRTGRTVSSLAELEASYPGIARARPSGADPRRPLIVVDSLSVSQSALQAGMLTVKIVPMLAVSRENADPQMVAEGIEHRVQRAAGTPPEKLPHVPILGIKAPDRRRTAPRADWLTGVKYRLNHLGYGAGRVAHLYDERCKRAIRTFQRDYRLRIDAIPGPKTQACLVRVCGY